MDAADYINGPLTAGQIATRGGDGSRERLSLGTWDRDRARRSAAESHAGAICEIEDEGVTAARRPSTTGNGLPRLRVAVTSVPPGKPSASTSNTGSTSLPGRGFGQRASATTRACLLGTFAHDWALDCLDRFLRQRFMPSTASCSKGTVGTNDSLDRDRDIPNLIGARNLYIGEIYDVGQSGDTQKPFGRVFYTKDKSLIFYGYDLDQQPSIKKVGVF
jgi:hypothetical protein